MKLVRFVDACLVSVLDPENHSQVKVVINNFFHSPRRSVAARGSSSAVPSDTYRPRPMYGSPASQGQAFCGMPV